MYNVFAINERTKHEIKMNKTPMTHKEACTFKAALMQHNSRILIVRGA